MKTLAAAVMVAMTAAAAPSVTGTWTMNVTGGPHGDATMALTLEQKGTTVTGSFASGHSPEMTVSGEFVDGSLKIETAADKDGDQVTFTARLKDDGTLAGYISSPIGDMKWTATRAEAKQGKDR
jgi:hypothetical protein